MGRGPALWTDETIELVKKEFIAVAVPTWVCRTESPEGEFLRSAGIDKRWVSFEIPPCAFSKPPSDRPDPRAATEKKQAGAEPGTLLGVLWIGPGESFTVRVEDAAHDTDQLRVVLTQLAKILVLSKACLRRVREADSLSNMPV